MNTVDDLAAVIAATARAHHDAFVAGAGVDPEWPIWYAEHLVDDVRRITGRRGLTMSDLVYVLVGADRAVKAEGIDDWPRVYAERIAAFAR